MSFLPHRRHSIKEANIVAMLSLLPLESLLTRKFGVGELVGIGYGVILLVVLVGEYAGFGVAVCVENFGGFLEFFGFLRFVRALVLVRILGELGISVLMVFLE